MVLPDSARRFVEVRWYAEQVLSSPGPTGHEVASYEVALGIDGYYIEWGSSPEPVVHLPWKYLGHSIPVELSLRVVVHLTDGSASDPRHLTFELPARYELPGAPEWSIDEPTVIVDDPTRKAGGLDYWIDGNLGFAEVAGATHGFGPNGPQISRWRVGDQQFLAESTEPRCRISGENADYASGGPVYADPDNGQLLMLYHGELHPAGEERAFWSFIGLARSTDDGRSWLSLGRIIEPNIAVDSPQRMFFTEIGGAPYVVRDGYMYVYFRETTTEGRSLNMSVARAPLDAVLQTASGGSPPSFAKWHQGTWSEPGLGGRASDLMDSSPMARWFDVVFMADHDLCVMVHSDGMARSWACVVRTSIDGITWSEPGRLCGPEQGEELLYVSLSSPDLSSQRIVHGDEIDLYRVRSARSGAQRWDVAELERRRMRYLGSPPRP